MACCRRPTGTAEVAELPDLTSDTRAFTWAPSGDVVIWSGDPLDVMSRALHVYVEGREVYTWNESKGEGDVADPYYREN